MIHPVISGNKWRKLKYLLSDAARLHKTHLVTFGGAFSNHLLATACTAAKFGYSSTGIVRGEAVSNDVLMLCRLFGMQLIFIDRTSYRDKHNYFRAHFGQDESAYFVDEGGAGALAVQGCSELTDELNEPYDHLFCPAGTGTTAAGIIKGGAVSHPDMLVHVIPVLKAETLLRDEINKYTDHSFEMHTGYHFGGYAKTTVELLRFIETFCRHTGMLIEPVYTGKMFYALYDLIRQDHFRRGDKILAIHTGGLTGILGMADKFRALS